MSSTNVPSLKLNNTRKQTHSTLPFGGIVPFSDTTWSEPLTFPGDFLYLMTNMITMMTTAIMTTAAIAPPAATATAEPPESPELLALDCVVVVVVVDVVVNAVKIIHQSMSILFEYCHVLRLSEIK